MSGTVGGEYQSLVRPAALGGMVRLPAVAGAEQMPVPTGDDMWEGWWWRSYLSDFMAPLHSSRAIHSMAFMHT